MNITWNGLLFVWQGLWGFLISIPSSFWGVIVGSMLSLAGIVITNRATTSRLKVQLESDRRLKADERRMSLRRETYLEVAEQLSRSIQMLLVFQNLDKDVTNLDEQLSSKSGYYARAYAIASPELISALLHLVHVIGEGLLQGYSLRLQVQGDINRRTWLREHTAQLLREQSRWLEEMRSYNLAGQDVPSRWEVIERNFNFATEQLTRFNDELAELEIALVKKQFEIAEKQIAATEQCSALVPAVIKAVREELEFDYAATSIERALAESMSRQREALNAFMNNAQSLLSNAEATIRSNPAS